MTNDKGHCGYNTSTVMDYLNYCDMVTPNKKMFLKSEVISTYTLNGVRHQWIRLTYYDRSELVVELKTTIDMLEKAC